MQGSRLNHRKGRTKGDRNGEMTFHFIDNNAPVSEDARRRIRSHAATGRNLGKKFTRGRKNKELKPAEYATGNSSSTYSGSLIRTPGKNEIYHELQNYSDMPMRIEKQVGDGLDLQGLPVSVTSGDKMRAQKVMSLIVARPYAPELAKAVVACGTTPLFTELYFKDATFFHGMTALFTLVLSRLCNEGEHPKAAMSHHVHTLRLLNKNLSGIDPASYGNMAAIVVVLQYERHVGRYEQGLVHMNGLLRMVELRGGISKMAQAEPTIAFKLFRTDLDYALILGSETVFRATDVSLPSHSLLGLEEAAQHTQILENQRVHGRDWQSELPTGLSAVFLDVASLTHIVNEAAAGRVSKVSDSWLHHTVITLGYQLVNECSLNKAGEKYSILGRAVHFGLAAYFMTFLRGFDSRVATSQVQIRLARRITAEGLSRLTGSSTVEMETLLWMICVTSALSLTDSDLCSLLPALSQIVHSLGVCCWNAASDVLSRFPWVNVMHDKYGKCLWDFLRSRSLAPACQHYPKDNHSILHQGAIVIHG